MAFPQEAADLEYDADRRASEAEYFGAVLREFVDIGLDLARTMQFEVRTRTQLGVDAADDVGSGSGSAAATPGADAAPAFDRVARAVRRCIMLARALGEAPAVRTDDAGVQTAARSEARIAARTVARTRIIRDVEDTISRRVTEAEGESLRGELLERLREPEFEDDIANRPVAEIIVELCRDLGITAPPGVMPWLRRMPADIVTLRRLAALPAAANANGDLGDAIPNPARRREPAAPVRDG